MPNRDINTDLLKKQIRKNLIFNVSLFVINLLLGAWLVHFFVATLGTIQYGFIALSAALNQYFSIATITVTGSVARFLTINIQRDQRKEALTTINTAFFSTLALIVILILPAFYLCLNITVFFNVPQNIEGDISVLVLFSIIGFLINLLGSILQVNLYSRNRLDIIKLLDFTFNLFRALFIILFFFLDKPNLSYAGYAAFGSAQITFLLSLYFSGRELGYMELSTRYISFAKLKELLGMGGWSIVHQAGDLLFFNAELIIINNFIGIKEAGIYGIILTVSSLTKGMIGSASSIMGPIMYKYYSNYNTPALIITVNYYIRILSLLLAYILTLFALFGDSIFKIWIGNDFPDMTNVLLLKLCALFFVMPVGILFNVFRAYLKVKIPALTALALGVINVILALTFSSAFNSGLTGIALAGLISSFIQALCSLIYAQNILLLKQWYLFRPILKSLMVITPLILSIYIIKGVSGSYLFIIISTALISMIFLLVFASIFTKKEREALFNFLIPGYRHI